MKNIASQFNMIKVALKLQGQIATTKYSSFRWWRKTSDALSYTISGMSGHLSRTTDNL